MIDLDGILKSSIVSVAGQPGYDKFQKDRGTCRGKLLNAVGEPDVHEIINMLLDVFPEDQAAAIADLVLTRFGEGKLADRPAPVKMPGSDQPAAAHSARSESTAKSNLARFSNTYTSEIEDVINEAISLRKSMGKPIHNIDQAVSANSGQTNGNALQAVEALVVEHVPVSKRPLGDTSSLPELPQPENGDLSALSTSWSLPEQSELSPERLSREIIEFLLRQDSLLSINSTEFSTYLKDKGYVFEEKKILEQLYAVLEQRKARVRAWVLQDIKIFLGEEKWPSEERVQIFIQKLKTDGIVYDDSEIKRMVIAEMMRKI